VYFIFYLQEIIHHSIISKYSSIKFISRLFLFQYLFHNFSQLNVNLKIGYALFICLARIIQYILINMFQIISGHLSRNFSKFIHKIFKGHLSTLKLERLSLNPQPVLILI